MAIYFSLNIPGLGFANFFASAVVAIYYNMLLAWTIYYMIASFTTGTLPWETCDSSFNTDCEFYYRLVKPKLLLVNACTLFAFEFANTCA